MFSLRVCCVFTTVLSNSSAVSDLCHSTAIDSKKVTRLPCSMIILRIESQGRCDLPSHSTACLLAVESLLQHVPSQYTLDGEVGSGPVVCLSKV